MPARVPCGLARTGLYTGAECARIGDNTVPAHLVVGERA